MTEVFDRSQIKAWKPKRDRYSLDFKVLWIKPGESLEGLEKGQAVLPTGNADGNPVTILNHVIGIHSLACITKQLL